MVKIKEDCQEQGERNGEENITDWDFPKPDKPRPVEGGCEGTRHRERLQVDRSHFTEILKAGEKDDGEGRAIVAKEDAHVMVEETGVSEDGARIADDQDEEGDGDGEVGGFRRVLE